MKKIILLFLIICFGISFTSANSFAYNYLKTTTSSGGDTNYSLVNVNNSQFLQGYTPTTLGDLFLLNSGDTMTGNLIMDTGTQVVLPLTADYNNPSLELGGDGSKTGIISDTTHRIKYIIDGTNYFTYTNYGVGTEGAKFQSTSSTGASFGYAGVSYTQPTIHPRGDIDSGLGSGVVDGISLIAGGVEGIRITESAGVITTSMTGNVGIGTASPSYPLEVNVNISGISIYSQANISATGYLTRTSIYDKSDGDALDYIKDASYYITSGKIDDTKFYGYAGNFKITDYSKPIKIYHIEYNDTSKNNETIEEIIYPYTKMEGAVSLDKEIDLLRQAVYELKIENQELKQRLDNAGIK